MWGPTLTEPYGIGLGFRQVVRPDPPGANTNLAVVMDSRYRSRLVSCVFALHTDANAANRYVTVEYQDATFGTFAVGAAAVVVVANTTSQRYCGDIWRGQAEWAAGTDILIPLPFVWLEGGDTLAINVAGKQAGDTLTAIKLLFERFPTGPAVIPGDAAADATVFAEALEG